MVCSSLPTVIVRNTPRALRICHSPGRARRASRTVRRARVTCRCREPADAALKNDGESVAREAWSGSTEPDTICVPFGLPLLRQEQYCRQATLCRLCTCRRVSRPHYQRRTSPRGCTLHATARTANIRWLMPAEEQRRRASHLTVPLHFHGRKRRIQRWIPDATESATGLPLGNILSLRIALISIG